MVGFLNEPADAGLPNGASLSIRDTETEEPFEDLGDTLEVEVTFGDETFTSSLRPQFGEPGSYRLDFVPSRPGQWEFPLLRHGGRCRGRRDVRGGPGHV